jgi:hypothetical protein
MSRPIQTLPHVQPPRARRKARIAGVVAAALVISWGAPAANAYWQTLSNNSGGARADSVLGVAAPTASAPAGAGSVSWLASTTAAGRPVSGYTVARYSSATGGTKVAAGGACAGTVTTPITTLSCSEAALPAGTWYYTVTPVLGSWAGPESARSVGVFVADTTKPDAPLISAPAIVNNANVTEVPVSVTAEPGSSVTVTITDALPVATRHTVSYVLAADGSSQTTSVNLSTLTDGIVTYTAVVTDAAGNVSDPRTASSTKDLIPTAKVTLGNQNGNADQGDTVSIKYSADIDSNSICSAWTNGGPAPDITGNGVVTVTINSANILSVTTTTGAVCAPKIGPVALNGVYVSTGILTFKGNGNGGNASKITWNSSNQTLTITLGSRTGTANSNVGASSPTVAPPTGVKDVAGNQAISAAPDAASGF